MTIELTALGFPEALRWRDGELWFSDMFRARVVRWAPGSAPHTVIDRASGGPEMPGGLGWLPDGSLLVVDCLERRVLRLRDGEITVYAELAGLMTHPANDMHVDADATVWVGGYGFDPEADHPRAAPLVRIGSDGVAALTDAVFVFANGCERDAAGALVVAETFADRVSLLARGAAKSTTLAQLPAGSGPDGLSIAPDGTLYVALAFAGELVAVDLTDRGAGEPRVIHRPSAIAEGPAAGAIGVYDCAVHPDGRRIAIAMASADESLALHHDTGRIVIVDLPTPIDSNLRKS